MKEKLLTREYILECLEYRSEDGVFAWKERPLHHFKNKHAHAIWNGRYSGNIAGTVTKYGYIAISINKKLFAAHRLAWIIQFGSWPSEQIDHINRNPSDNRIENLRDVPASQNLYNRGAAAKNKSGRVGVSYCKRTKSWCSTFGRKRIGRFKSLEEAIESRVLAEKESLAE
ncbi:HNH endonuclease signature motif containing protein [Serratia sp. IR-2025]